jgi:aminomethyltransferase
VADLVSDAALLDLKRFQFATSRIAGAECLACRTGYTGEDGFEIFVPPQSADRVWQAILTSGAPLGVVPAGLGARDTLRLEAAMRLYGNEIDDTTTPLEADLAWIVGWNKSAMNGLAALRDQKERGADRRLVGFEILDHGIARRGCDVISHGAVVGTVTSGTQTPFLKKSIGMAYVPIDHAAETELDVDIRGRHARARVVSLPFYRRARV